MNLTLFQNAYLRRIDTIKQPEELNLLVADALRFVVQNVFANISNALIITISTNKGPVEFWLHDIMGKLLFNWSFMTIQLVVLAHGTKHLNIPGKRYCNLILIDSATSLVKTNISEYNRNYDNFEYYFIFLQTRDALMASEMKIIFKHCFDSFWLHCNVMVQNVKGEILIYTYFPFKENDCFQTEPVLINRFQRNRFENVAMFPNKLKNLHECPLKLSTWEVPPFVVKAKNKKYPNIPVSGFEIVTLIAISEHMNFTFDVEWIPPNTNQNDSNEIGLLTRLERQETNITMGYFRRTITRDQMATSSYVTYYIPIAAILIRKPTHNIALGMIAFPFDDTTWIMMFVVYAIIGFLNFFNNSAKDKGGIFPVFEIIIGVSTRKLPKENAKRISLLTLIISSFIFRSFYQSLLFFLFRSNFYQTTPATLQGLAENGYKAVTTVLSMQFLHSVPQIEDKSLPVNVISTTDEMVPLRYLYDYRNESWVAMTSEEFALRYVREELPSGNALLILSMSVKDQQIVFYLLKHSYLSARFDYYISHFHQAGLIMKWREWTTSEYQVTEGRSSTTNPDALMVSMKQLLGFVLLIALMNSIAIFIFGLELLSKKYKWLKKPLGIIL